jgi:hypothetical protein
VLDVLIALVPSPGIPSPGPTASSLVASAPPQIVAGSGATLADWLQRWGSVAAVIATLALLWHEIREARKGREAANLERREAAEDRELARRDRELAAVERRDTEATQARTVVFSNVDFDLRSTDDGRSAIRTKLTVTNYSASPILGVIVQVHAYVADHPRTGFHVGISHVLGPAESLPVDVIVGTSAEGVPRRVLNDVDAVVIFYDDAGRLWRRWTLDWKPERVVESGSTDATVTAE